jgi:hypothetical protein
LPNVAENLDKRVLQSIVGIVAVVHNTVGNGKHGITILLVKVALGNTLVADASLHQCPFNIAFVSGDQPYNVPQSSNGLAFYKSTINPLLFAILPCRVFSIANSTVKGTGIGKWLYC